MIIVSTNLHCSPLYWPGPPNTLITLSASLSLSLPFVCSENQLPCPLLITIRSNPSLSSNQISPSLSLSTMQHEKFSILPRTSSSKSTKRIIPSNYMRSSSLKQEPDDFSNKPLVRKDSPAAFQSLSKTRTGFSTLFRSLFNIFSFPTIIPTCRWLSIPTQLSTTPSLGRKVTGTLFGHRRGHVSFAIQDDPRSEPVLLIELAVSTSTLVKEMSSGLVRIALECEKGPPARGRPVKLFNEPMWTMYCNGRSCGYALSRSCTESDWHVLSTVQSISVGAGVIPVVDDGTKGSGSEGELLYMRARFERVVGNRDSEAFYMMNPDGNGGPELSIFLLRM